MGLGNYKEKEAVRIKSGYKMVKDINWNAEYKEVFRVIVGEGSWAFALGDYSTLALAEKAKRKYLRTH